jgi:hypothetical protein
MKTTHSNRASANYSEGHEFGWSHDWRSSAKYRVLHPSTLKAEGLSSGQVVTQLDWVE